MSRRIIPTAEVMLQRVRDTIIKGYGQDAIVNDQPEQLMAGRVRSWVPSNLLGMDAVLGRNGNGLPVGRLIEMFGAEGQGKSSLAYYLIGQAQNSGGLCFLIDTEGSYDVAWAEQLGITNETLTVLSMTEDSSLEGYFDMIEDIGRRVRDSGSDIPILIVLDTVYCALTREQLQPTSYLATERMATLARALAQHLPTLCNFASRYDIGLVFINQIRDNIGVIYGDKFRTPGGHALRHMASVRVAVRRVRKKPGHSMESVAVNVKNKIAPAFSEAYFEISPDGLRELHGMSGNNRRKQTDNKKSDIRGRKRK